MKLDICGETVYLWCSCIFVGCMVVVPRLGRPASQGQRPLTLAPDSREISDSRTLGLSVSRAFGLLDSWYLGLLGSWTLGLFGFRALSLLDSWALRLQVSQALGLLNSQTLGLLNSWAFGLSNSRTLGILDSWNLGLFDSQTLKGLSSAFLFFRANHGKLNVAFNVLWQISRPNQRTQLRGFVGCAGILDPKIPRSKMQGLLLLKTRQCKIKHETVMKTARNRTVETVETVEQ